MNRAVSSRSDSRSLICLRKTPFNHSKPLGLSRWMPSEDELCGRESSILRATSQWQDALLLYFSNYVVDVAHPLIHDHCILVCQQLRHCCTRETQDSHLPVRLDPRQNPDQTVPNYLVDRAVPSGILGCVKYFTKDA